MIKLSSPKNEPASLEPVVAPRPPVSLVDATLIRRFAVESVANGGSQTDARLRVLDYHEIQARAAFRETYADLVAAKYKDERRLIDVTEDCEVAKDRLDDAEEYDEPQDLDKKPWSQNELIGFLVRAALVLFCLGSAVRVVQMLALSSLTFDGAYFTALSLGVTATVAISLTISTMIHRQEKQTGERFLRIIALIAGVSFVGFVACFALQYGRPPSEVDPFDAIAFLDGPLAMREGDGETFPTPISAWWERFKRDSVPVLQVFFQLLLEVFAAIYLEVGLFEEIRKRGFPRLGIAPGARNPEWQLLNDEYHDYRGERGKLETQIKHREGILSEHAKHEQAYVDQVLTLTEGVFAEKLSLSKALFGTNGGP